jgi:hypothetical protein
MLKAQVNSNDSLENFGGRNERISSKMVEYGSFPLVASLTPTRFLDGRRGNERFKIKFLIGIFVHSGRRAITRSTRTEKG